MTDLIKRLEEAAAGSADLDREVERALGIIPMGVREDGPWGRLQKPWTQCIDASAVLATRVLGNHHALRLIARTSVGMALDGDNGQLRDLPRLLCIAVLKATDTGRE